MHAPQLSQFVFDPTLVHSTSSGGLMQTFRLVEGAHLDNDHWCLPCLQGLLRLSLDSLTHHFYLNGCVMHFVCSCESSSPEHGLVWLHTSSNHYICCCRCNDKDFPSQERKSWANREGFAKALLIMQSLKCSPLCMG